MKTMKMLALPLAIMLSGCATTEYLGKSYAPTSHVDIYFATSDIHRPYEVMGEAKTEGSEALSFESIEQQLVKDAMAKGADAVLIEGMDTIVVGATTSNQGTIKEKPRYVVDKNGKLKNVGGSDHYSGYTSTIEQRDKVISSKLLKYTQ